MHLKYLNLKQFRNYESERIEFSPGLNVVYGMNASGKSNILEAVYLLAKARSLRTSNIREAAQWGKEGFFVRGVFKTSAGDKDISIKVLENGRKTLKVNGKEVEKLNELISQIPTVLFMPDDLRLIKADPEQRRKFINSILVQTDANYLLNLINYNKILAERNRALKQLYAGELRKEDLEPWTKGLIESGLEIINARKKCIDELNILLGDVKALFSRAGFNVALKYSSITEHDNFGGDLHEKFEALIDRKKHAEFAFCQTLAGPHRDDIEIYGDGKSLRSYGSQGQQRKSVLCLKIAAVLILRRNFNEWPVTLFDDVLSELDEYNQKALEDVLSSLSSAEPSDSGNSWQCFITTAERIDRWSGRNINVVKVEHGKICV